MSWRWGEFGNYISAADKQQRANAAARKLEKQGRTLSPVHPAGRSIASSFWGKAWCQNLESYSDYESRLPRGRSYVRQGAVLDLQIQRGIIKALVSGTRLYEIVINIEATGKKDWMLLKQDCAGKVGSLMDLLQGKLSAQVMEIITRKESGLFPKPKEIHLNCSCPDWADMCKHIAAVLYGIGARLDQSPELLFVLRGVDHAEMIAAATQSLHADLAAPATGETAILDVGSLAEVFGIELGELESAMRASPKSKPAKTPLPGTGKSTKAASARENLPTRLPVRKASLAIGTVTPKKRTRTTPPTAKRKPTSVTVSKKSRKRRRAAK